MNVYVGTSGELSNAYIGIPYPESISLDKNFISLTTIGQTEQLTATIEPTVSDKTIIWTSSDDTIATVDSTGLVTCVTPGECTITATTVNGLTATCGVVQKEYQEVEWIGSSGTQRIDTGYIPNEKTKAEWKMGDWNDPLGSYCIFGTVYNFWVTPGRGFSVVTDAYMFNNSYGVTHGMRDGGDHFGELSQAGLIVDGVTKATPATTTFTCPYSLLLFCTRNNGTPAEYGTFRYYYYKLYDDGTLVRDFVPCYRIADGVIGMYDLVNGVFYTNSGSGTFTKGADV